MVDSWSFWGSRGERVSWGSGDWGTVRECCSWVCRELRWIKVWVWLSSDFVREVREVARAVGREDGAAVVVEEVVVSERGVPRATVNKAREWRARIPSGGRESARRVSGVAGESEVASFFRF